MSNTILISYDLGGPETSASYKRLIKAIEAAGILAKPLESFWLVKTPDSAVGVRDVLRQYLDANDKLLVINVTGDETAWVGLPKGIEDWLRANMGG